MEQYWLPQLPSLVANANANATERAVFQCEVSTASFESSDRSSSSSFQIL